MSVFKPFVKYRLRCRFIDAWIMSQLRVYWSTCKINNSYEGKVLNPILDRITKVDLKFEAHLFSVWSKIPNFWKLLISLFLETQNSFSPCQFQVKIYLILYNLKWYSTTKIMLYEENSLKSIKGYVFCNQKNLFWFKSWKDS